MPMNGVDDKVAISNAIFVERIVDLLSTHSSVGGYIRRNNLF